MQVGMISRRSRRHVACGRCHYCARPVFPAGSAEVLADRSCLSTQDHYTPFALTEGASLKQSRLVVACSRCNNLKGHTPPEVFEYFVRQSDMTKSQAELNKEYQRFCYLLTVAGFRSAKALSIVKRGRPIDMPNCLRRKSSTSIAVPASLPQSRGTYTKRDLRKGQKGGAR